MKTLLLLITLILSTTTGAAPINQPSDERISKIRAGSIRGLEVITTGLIKRRLFISEDEVQEVTGSDSSIPIINAMYGDTNAVSNAISTICTNDGAKGIEKLKIAMSAMDMVIRQKFDGKNKIARRNFSLRNIYTFTAIGYIDFMVKSSYQCKPSKSKSVSEEKLMNAYKLLLAPFDDMGSCSQAAYGGGTRSIIRACGKSFDLMKDVLWGEELD